jgi:hypothetical protein
MLYNPPTNVIQLAFDLAHWNLGKLQRLLSYAHTLFPKSSSDTKTSHVDILKQIQQINDTDIPKLHAASRSWPLLKPNLFIHTQAHKPYLQTSRQLLQLSVGNTGSAPFWGAGF